jgi:acetoin utilization deacetylase AcuC-like enzyme
LAKKVLIVDWDVHHGNGTQHIFEKDDSVFYYSTHQYPFYPGTGGQNETGIDNGKGFTLNRPLRAGGTDKVYIDAIENDLTDIEKQFKADLVIISAGFDAHRDDPLAGMLVTEDGYWKLTELICRYAWRYSGGKILSVLEGGYNLKALSDSVQAHLDCLLKH